VLYRKAGGAAPPPAAIAHEPPAPRILFAPEPVAPQAELPEEPVAVEAGAAPPRTPDDAGELARAARLCADQGRLGEAIEWCEKAIGADKLNPAHYYLLATVRHEQGQADAAAQSLTRALYLDADFALAHFALGNLRLSQGRRREAERHFTNTLAVLRARAQDEALPESDGLTAGRLAEIVASLLASQPRATT
jgi:chemotaxis protein methyltransferase CheR